MITCVSTPNTEPEHTQRQPRLAFAQIVAVDVGGLGIARDAVFFTGPAAKIDQFAAFGTKWPKQILRRPLNPLATGGTGYDSWCV